MCLRTSDVELLEFAEKLKLSNKLLQIKVQTVRQSLAGAFERHHRDDHRLKHHT